MYNYSIKYKTFDSLMADVKTDFKNYDLRNLIDDQDMIKVAKMVNYDLGLRIHKTKEIVLEVEKSRVKLPLDFLTLNFMLMCGEYTVKSYLPQGTHIEERIIPAPVYTPHPPPIDLDSCKDMSPPPCPPCLQCGNPCCQDPCPDCSRCENSCTLNCKGDCVQLVQILKSECRTYKFFQPVRLLPNAMDIDCDCPNIYWTSPFTAWIKDGWLYTNFKEGKLYLNYQGLMEDEDGNLLVINHDMINNYYEYALKRRIIENLIMNDEPVNQAKIQIIEARYTEARSKAQSIVNTSNFSELKAFWNMTKKAWYNKYYSAFDSFNFH
jgi:hypothetical protein